MPHADDAPVGRSDDGALVILHVDSERGMSGGEVQVLGLVRHLAAAGDRQAVAADPRGGLARAAAALGVAVLPLRIRNHLDVVAGRRLAGLLASGGYDIVHFHTARAHAMSAFIGRSPARRIVTRRMDYRLRGGSYARWLYNRGTDAVVAISEGVRSALVASGVRADRIVVVPSGVDVTRFAAGAARRVAERARLGIGPGEFVVAIVGALEERKGHVTLLEALALVREPPVRLLCAGSGSLAAALAARADALGIAERVRFLGHVDDVPGLLAAVDAVAMPSRHEGLGVAALEAMAAARPLVATRVGGLPEVVGADAGLLVDADDPVALAAALTRLAREPATARAFGEAGRARVAERFTLDAMARGTRAVYRRVLAADARDAR
jgi:glycosyltransferase involved in cell wall biosynthesis